ncbi:efflux transporter outer membrane subunit [Burkholderia guangdongensis]|uniref:efflux transporter outer membrane subunit n=1 Tax=Burkholderia guangdongensis TaxID=1792500 RepID=UPI0015C79804
MNPLSSPAGPRSIRGRFRSLARIAGIAGFCAAALGGCMDLSVPAYQRPDMPAKATWAHAHGAVSASDTVNPEWWKAFDDPTLDALIDKAIAGNVDIRVLAARIGVAGAQIGEAHAAALPTADLGAGIDYEKVTHASLSKTYDLGSQVNWDIDIWGKVEKDVQAQKAEYHATEADWRAGYLTLVADVSTTYFQILQYDDQIEQAGRTLDKNRQILAIYRQMVANGVAPQTDVLRQSAEINGLANQLLELHRSRDNAENALATLLGVPAGEFRMPAGHLRQRVKLPDVPMGLPAQLLARRPDVVAAQYRILESYDEVGAAKLAQLPSISLTGRGGTAAFALSDLFRAFTFSFLPSIDLPMFDPGVRAHIKTTEAQGKLAEEQYRQTVFAAFKEVENALVDLDAHKQQRVQLEQQSERLRAVAAQVEAQLREGLVSQLEVLESERSVASAELALLANHQQILSDTVTLYKAIGGGWRAVEIRNEGDEPVRQAMQ